MKINDGKINPTGGFITGDIQRFGKKGYFLPAHLEGMAELVNGAAPPRMPIFEVRSKKPLRDRHNWVPILIREAAQQGKGVQKVYVKVQEVARELTVRTSRGSSEDVEYIMHHYANQPEHQTVFVQKKIVGFLADETASGKRNLTLQESVVRMSEHNVVFSRDDLPQRLTDIAVGTLTASDLKGIYKRMEGTASAPAKASLSRRASAESTDSEIMANKMRRILSAHLSQSQLPPIKDAWTEDAQD